MNFDLFRIVPVYDSGDDETSVHKAPTHPLFNVGPKSIEYGGNMGFRTVQAIPTRLYPLSFPNDYGAQVFCRIK